MRKHRLRKQAEKIAGADLDWWMMTYYRAACRIDRELNRPTGLDISLMWRRLQELYDHIIPLMEAERAERKRSAIPALAINQCITDHGLPASCRLIFNADAGEQQSGPPDEAA